MEIKDIGIVLALCNAKKEFKAIGKNKTNPGFKFDYADLSQYLDATQDALCKHGLFITQTIEERGLVTTIRYAYSQDTIQSFTPLKETRTPQEFGSLLTYLRRYCYAAILGLASDDDDANESSKPETKKQEPKNMHSVPKEIEDPTKQLPGLQKRYESAKDKLVFLDAAEKGMKEKYPDASDYNACMDYIAKKRIESNVEVK